MRRISMRNELTRKMTAAINNADGSVIDDVAEKLAVGCRYKDERDDLLIAMADAGITSTAFPLEQENAKAERDARRAAHLAGVTTRNEVEATKNKVKEEVCSNDKSTFTDTENCDFGGVA